MAADKFLCRSDIALMMQAESAAVNGKFPKGVIKMIYSHEVETMCPIAQGVAHGAAPIPEEAK
ncbi:MAG: hypothetical protein IKJ87_05060, partial [Ruminococcus sp.]|nr:hypothetical protein [Ruminococcus sp.]